MIRRNRSSIVLGVSAFLFLSFTGLSLSQVSGSTPASTGIDLTQILVACINQLFAVVLAIGTYLINQKVKDQQMRDLLSKALTNAVGVVKGEATNAIKSSGITVQTTGNPTLDAGVQYVVNNAAEALAHFNISESKVAEKIVARVGLLEAGGTSPS